MKGASKYLLIMVAFLFVLSLSVSCAKKQSVQGSSEEMGKGKTTEIKEEAVPEKAQEPMAASGMKEMTPATFSDIHFDFDKSVVREDARPILEKVGTFLLENGGANVLIEGHCDERGTSEYNLALGERRAQAAKNYLSTLGVKGDRVKTISYGEEKPLDSGHNDDAWAKNRRGHFVVLK